MNNLIPMFSPAPKLRVKHELLPMAFRFDRDGNTTRATFFHTGGYGLYFFRVGAGWRVEVYENDDDPEERAYIFGRTANSMRNALRLVSAWRNCR